MTEYAQKLSDQDFETAIIALLEGQVPFESPAMLQRFGEMIRAKLTEIDEFSGEDG
jgi:hypothetical protein